MQLTNEVRGDAHIVRIEENRIDAGMAIQFKDAVRAATEGGPERVILDMENVAFLDSSGLGAIVATMKVFHGHKSLELAHLSPTVAKVFALTRMDSVFKIHDRLDTGASAVNT